MKPHMAMPQDPNILLSFTDSMLAQDRYTTRADSSIIQEGLVEGNLGFRVVMVVTVNHCNGSDSKQEEASGRQTNTQ